MLTLNTEIQRNPLFGTGSGSKDPECYREKIIAQELCESRGGRPGLPSLIVLVVSVGVKQQWKKNLKKTELGNCLKEELDDLDDPSLIVRPYGLCGRKATQEVQRKQI